MHLTLTGHISCQSYLPLNCIDVTVFILIRNSFNEFDYISQTECSARLKSGCFAMAQDNINISVIMSQYEGLYCVNTA